MLLLPLEGLQGAGAVLRRHASQTVKKHNQTTIKIGAMNHFKAEGRMQASSKLRLKGEEGKIDEKLFVQTVWEFAFFKAP